MQQQPLPYCPLSVVQTHHPRYSFVLLFVRQLDVELLLSLRFVRLEILVPFFIEYDKDNEKDNDKDKNTINDKVNDKDKDKNNDEDKDKNNNKDKFKDNDKYNDND